jgi:hypothetical protein
MLPVEAFAGHKPGVNAPPIDPDYVYHPRQLYLTKDPGLYLWHLERLNTLKLLRSILASENPVEKIDQILASMPEEPRLPRVPGFVLNRAERLAQFDELWNV